MSHTAAARPMTVAAWPEGKAPNSGLGLGFLAKGPVAWLPLAGVLLGRWLRPAEFHLPLSSLFAGILLTLLLVGLWGVPALVATRGQFFTEGIGHHVVFRSLGIMEGHGRPGLVGFVLTLPLYFVTFFATNAMTFHSSGLDTARFRRIDLVAVLKTAK
jgi:hypothetical protein